MPPFDAGKLERLMAEAGMDWILATTRHNVRYLTGGYVYHFFARSPRQGMGQYLAVVGIPRDLKHPFYVGRNEAADVEAFGGIWIEEWLWYPPGERMTVRAAELAAQAVRQRGPAGATIGVEMPFLPADAFQTLRAQLPEARFVDATPVLAELRAVKQPHEIQRLREVHRITAEAIREVLASGHPDQTTRELNRRVERAVTARGAVFLYCYTNVGPGLLRTPSALRWGRGNPLHLDAGAEVEDYVSDVCRMGSVGKPAPEVEEMYRTCIQVVDRLREQIAPGMRCRDLDRLGWELMRSNPWGEYGRFLAHGLGMVSHEPPEVAQEGDRPLEEGMVISLEAEFLHPGVGHIKYEDSVVVTASGCEGLGDVLREWVTVE